MTARLSICDSVIYLMAQLDVIYINPSPSNGGNGDEMAPRHILSSRAHSDKIPTAIHLCFFGTICVSVKPTKLFVLPVILLPSWIYSTHRRPTKSEVPPVESLIPKTWVYSRWNFVAMCSRTRDMPGGHFTPPRCQANVAENRCREKG